MPRVRPGHITVFTLGCLAVAWVIVLLTLPVDYWTHLFNDRPIEWLQWVYLLALTVLAGYMSGVLRVRGVRGAATFWLLMAIGAALMFMEDAGDIRHALVRYVERATAGTWPAQWRRTNPQFVFELTYFAAIASVPLYALARFGRHVWHAARTGRYLLIGFVTYAIAAVSSATSHFWYDRLGHFINTTFMGGRMEVPQWPDEDWVVFQFVDGPIEESVELIGAAALLCAAVAYYGELDRQKTKAGGVGDTAPPESGGGGAAGKPRVRNMGGP